LSLRNYLTINRYLLGTCVNVAKKPGPNRVKTELKLIHFTNGSKT